MITALHIQDFVLINQASLSLDRGLTVLTGETGAGKSILLDALGYAVGGRATRATIRNGAQTGVVTTSFEPDGTHAVWALLEENGLQTDDDAVILRRVQTANGKSRAFINDQPVSIALLKKIGGCLLEIHGQHDGHGFLTASTHRSLLDEFGALQAREKKVRSLWQKRSEIEAKISEKRAQRAKALSEADYLRHVTHELDKLAPLVDEEEHLAARRTELMALEKITDDLGAAIAALSEDGLEARLSVSARRLSNASDALPREEALLSAVQSKIESAISEVVEARAAVEEVAQQLVQDTEELERVEERLFTIRSVARKHGVSADQLPAFHQRATQALVLLDEDEAGFGTLEAEFEACCAAYKKAANALSTARKKAAKKLDDAVAKELAPLKLGRAEFKTQVVSDEDTSGPTGIDQVEFLVATNPGAPAGPLKSIASGGELSRFVLAMKAALAAKENRTVIIFDEVDAGVGGAVASAVGERLARLARDAQVLVVTHSPQVAARADRHWLIEKNQTAKQTTTKVSVLSANERVEEIARMLSGETVTAEARQAALALMSLDGASKGASSRKKSA